MQDILDKLFIQEDLNDKEAKKLFTAISQGDLSDVQLSAVLMALKLKGESPTELAMAADVFRNVAIPFTSNDSLVDTCGTGGVGPRTINISTIVAICAASLGLKVAKHGNKSASSACGSADVLEYLGFNIDLNPKQAKYCIDKTNFTFLFAPSYHISFSKVAKVRKELKTRTIFNILGPLVSPAKPSYQLLGVYDKKLCLPLAKALQKLDVLSAMVINGSTIDEINLEGVNYIAQLKNGKITQYELRASDFGLDSFPLDSIKSDDIISNSKSFLRILKGEGSKEEKAYICANLACLLYINEKVDNLKEGVKISQELLSSAKAYDKFQDMIRLSHG